MVLRLLTENASYSLMTMTQSLSEKRGDCYFIWTQAPERYLKLNFLIAGWIILTPTNTN